MTTVIPAKSEGLVPVILIDPCGKTSLAVAEDQECFTKKSQLLVTKTLVDLTNDVIPLKLLNLTDQPKTFYQNTIAAWSEPVEEVPKASQQDAQRKETSSGRPCRVASSAASLPGHQIHLYEQAASCLDESQTALVIEFADMFTRHSINTGDSKSICHNPRCLSLSQKQKVRRCLNTDIELPFNPWASPIGWFTKRMDLPVFA